MSRGFGAHAERVHDHRRRQGYHAGTDLPHDAGGHHREQRAEEHVGQAQRAARALAIAVPRVSPTTAAGSTQAQGRSASEMRNCTWPDASPNAPASSVRTT